MKIKYLIFTLVAISLFLFFYGVRFSSKVGPIRRISFSKIENIRCDFWKYSGGEYFGGESGIGDFIDFEENSIAIKGDTLYIKKEPVAKIIEANKRYLARDYELILESLTDKKRAYYTAK